ncbi:MAG: DUF294 nucleotidyltransferase-like domain-containing protein [Rhodocyclaceae bacterium]|nr:DUF294 nucleotidyltransferase-like domain-containing protein [Rhodocyclaceae bacterium]
MSSTERAALSPNSALAALPCRVAPSLPPGATLRTALTSLDQHGADALAIVDPETEAPLGILTLRDVLRRVVLDGGDLSAPVAAVMTGGVLRLPSDATVHQASVTMVRRNVRHLVMVAPDGRYANIVSQADLYALPSARTGELVTAITLAPDVPALADIAADVRRFCAQLLAEGLGAEALCQQISALNDLISLRVIDLVLAECELPYVPWCWMVFGSEGRLEQTLSTDQDNGLIFAAPSAGEAARLRPIFIAFARMVNEALDACGFPLCKGNVMASNPALCLSLDEWREKFDGWLRVAEPEAILGATIYFDLRALFGEEGLVAELQAWLQKRVPDSPAFLRAMAESALNWQSPLAWWSGFRYDSKDFPHTIDLKMHGVRPFVDAARIWALANGVVATNTAERLRLVGPLLHRRPEESAAFIEALAQVQRLRLANQVAATAPGAANRIDPDQMNDLDRQILKEVFRQVKQLQQLIEVEFLRTS